MVGEERGTVLSDYSITKGVIGSGGYSQRGVHLRWAEHQTGSPYEKDMREIGGLGDTCTARNSQPALPVSNLHP